MFFNIIYEFFAPLCFRLFISIQNKTETSFELKRMTEINRRKGKKSNMCRSVLDYSESLFIDFSPLKSVPSVF